MTQDEMARVLKESEGKTVRVTDAQGRSAVLSVLNVDEEGCTCHVVGHPDYDPTLQYWWSFDEIADVEQAQTG